MSEANKALVRREIEEVFNAGDLDACEEIYAPDYVGHEPTTPEGIKGVEGARRFAATYREAFPDFHATIEDMFSEGGLVATRFTVRGAHEGDLEGIPSTGNRIEVSGIAISRVEGGKVAEDWTNFDALGLTQQIGAVPAEQPA